MATDIPEDVMAGIREYARAEWPDDADMRRWTIKNEIEGYNAIAELDFGAATEVRAAILAEALEYDQQWEMRASFVADEVRSFNALATIEPDDVPAPLVEEWKSAAAREHDWFQQRLDEVESRIEHHRYVERTRAKVEPIRSLLAEMERIVGSECYNGNIQNYSSWGVWEGEGRSFRYPASFVRGDRIEKRSGRTADLPAEQLITGHYRFGANELGIYRALIKIVDMLQRDFGFDPTTGIDGG